MYGYTTFYYRYQFMDVWVISLFGSLKKCCYEHSFVSLHGYRLAFLLDIYLRVELLCCVVTLDFTIWENCQTGFHSASSILRCHQQYTRILVSQHLHQYLLIIATYFLIGFLKVYMLKEATPGYILDQSPCMPYLWWEPVWLHYLHFGVSSVSPRTLTRFSL